MIHYERRSEGSGDPAKSDVVTPDANTELGKLYEVLLHNDDFNTMEHVVRSLMKVFGHPQPLSVKIMHEAHRRGEAIAEVESEESARVHRDQLISFGLIATLHRI